ncbi:AarF/UbiB family protein [Fluviispira multicolorata]|uniref:ABC1 atypical kinase-like domain-containing protein n=1 Tax=Fluviispira multicolorata TaxID=2654512 RepID=A0A833N646_9BACT|nr:AarF/UbiB family protein [Fluviispira multicolorata]KAB8032094.1 hypothetical protein GCL57_05455 [Fluviispira multicolorata]
MQSERIRKKRQALEKKKKNYKDSLEKVAAMDYRWVVPLAKNIRTKSNILAKFISFVFSDIATTPLLNQKMSVNRFTLMKGLTRILFPQSDTILTKIEKSIRTLQESIGEISSEILTDTEVTQELLAPFIETVCTAVEANPQLIALFGQPQILEEAFGPLGERIAGMVSLIPALSSQAAEKFPDLKETFFHSLFQLNKEERNQIYILAENILGEVYKEKVFPMLNKTLSSDPRGKVLAPILSGAIEAIPGESCINALLSIACTPHNEFSNGRVIAIAIQEIGGLYIKISQVISELCPPSLARELRTSQDDAGGIFPSIEKSWSYFKETLDLEEYSFWKPYLIIPKNPIRHFASASVGALYNIQLNKEGKERFGVDNILIKIQRPKLRELFAIQSEHILKLTDDAHKMLLEDLTLTSDVKSELLGLVSTLRRAVLNYHKQSQEELDFTLEEKNAEKVRIALGENKSIQVPRFFQTHIDTVFMEKMSGIKVTKIIQTKYLERREIADTIAKAYIELVFNKGVVWADPHPGNILYDDLTNQVSMIDLNPCFVWDIMTREEFKHLIYRLLLRDAAGVYRTLYHLVENPESLHSNTILDDLGRFLNLSMGSASLTRFVGEFIKTLSENQVDLKVEVQAALRGLSQIALTTSSISARNHFGTILRKQFTLKELVGTVWNVGVIRVSKVILSALFEFTRQMPEYDIGPVLDERDISMLSERTHELAKANVCHILFRRVSPEDHPNLKISQDGQMLLITSDLYIEIITKVRPASVRYVIETPSRKWLKERQEFVKLASIARSFCTIECLEQLRRNSLDDYWRIVEAWSKDPFLRTVEETQLIGEVRIAARNLYSLRFANIWESVFSGLPYSSKLIWRILMSVESWKESSKQNYLVSQKKKFGDVLLANLAYGSFFRIKILILEAILWYLRKKISGLKFSMHLLPMSTQELENLILFGLSRNFTRNRK